jgi:uncharacterized protein with gpF-like domain
MNGNTIIPTDAEHDAHYADHCSACGEVFRPSNPFWMQDDGGFDYCKQCTIEIEEENENEQRI